MFLPQRHKADSLSSLMSSNVTSSETTFLRPNVRKPLLLPPLPPFTVSLYYNTVIILPGDIFKILYFPPPPITS